MPSPQIHSRSLSLFVGGGRKKAAANLQIKIEQRAHFTHHGKKSAYSRLKRGSCLIAHRNSSQRLRAGFEETREGINT